MLSRREQAACFLPALQADNLLVLDEPTNDLIETIELLEERLLEFDGTLLLVSHDRDFRQRVTATLALDGKGAVTEYAADGADWLEG